MELVELEPSAEDADAAAEWNEALGPSRIRQILQAHTWSNLQLKDGPDHAASTRLKDLLDEAPEPEPQTSSASQDVTTAHIVTALSSECRFESGEREEEARAAAGAEDMTSLFRAVSGDGEVSFEELFASLASLKVCPPPLPSPSLLSSQCPGQAAGEGLSGSARKAHAEAVTKAFWTAVGGDEAELEGLDEES